MAPGFRINFPLPSFRSNSSTQTTPGSQPSQCSTPSTFDASPLSLPGSKAERILGGPETENVTPKKKQTRKERKVLRKFPSFMSVTLADLDNGASTRGHELPMLGMPTSHEPHYQASQPLRRRGSSPLLGDHGRETSATRDYFNYTTNAQAPTPESKSTLQSYYDRSRNPYPGSHSTFALSTAQNLAPRPGLTHNASSSFSSVSEAHLKESQTSLSHTRSQSGESKLSGGSKLSASSRIAGLPRRRPSVNDRPTLYPDAPPNNHAVSPPPALIDSTLPKSMRLGDQDRKPLERPKWWQRPKTDHPPVPSTSHQYEPGDASIRSPSMKVNIKRPKVGSSNWFDGFDEEDIHVEAVGESKFGQEGPLTRLAPEQTSSRDTAHPSSQRPQGGALTSRKSSFSSKSGRSDRKLTFKLDPSHLDDPVDEAPSSFLAPVRQTKIQSPGVRSTESCGNDSGIPPGIDLQISSVLNLSSSDDEDGASILSPGTASSSQGNRIRASVETSDYGEDILLGNAQSAQPLRPRPVVTPKVGRYRSPRRSKTPENVPPVPQIPSRHPVSQRNSSLRWRDVTEEKSGSNTETGGDSTVDSGSNVDTPLTTPTSGRTSTSSQKKKGTFRGSRLMKVTSEEEKLLEAMRHKRASIRVNEFQRGFNKALALQTDTATSQTLRPRTSGATDGGRDSFRRSSSLYESRYDIVESNRSSVKSSTNSQSPMPLLPPTNFGRHKSKSSLTFLSGNRKSLSTDNLLLGEEVIGADFQQTAFPFPPSAPPPKSKLPKPPVQLQISDQGQRDSSPSKHSPSLSFGASDVMAPSTPSTGNMPLTPPPMSLPMLPPDLTLFQGTQGQLCRTFSGSSRKEVEKPGHDRKRTASSVVVLDGVEIAARQADEERDIVGWALDSY